MDKRKIPKCPFYYSKMKISALCTMLSAHVFMFFQKKKTCKILRFATAKTTFCMLYCHWHTSLPENLDTVPYIYIYICKNKYVQIYIYISMKHAKRCESEPLYVSLVAKRNLCQHQVTQDQMRRVLQMPSPNLEYLSWILNLFCRQAHHLHTQKITSLPRIHHLHARYVTCTHYTSFQACGCCCGVWEFGFRDGVSGVGS